MFGLRKYRGDIKALAVSPDGSRCVTGEEVTFKPDADARIWALPSLKAEMKLKGHQSFIPSAAWSPTAKHIATGGGYGWAHWNGIFGASEERRDGVIRVWEADSARQVARFGDASRRVDDLVFSNDGLLLLSGSGNPNDQGLVQLWDVSAERELARFGDNLPRILAVAFSPDGNLVAAGSRPPLVTERVPGMFGEMTMTFHSHDTSAGVRTIRLFEAASGHDAQDFEYTGWINSLRFSPCGSYLLTVGDEYLLWNVASGSVAYRFRTEGSNWASSVDISSDGAYVAIGCGGIDKNYRLRDCCVRIWRLEKPREIAVFPHKRSVKRVAFIPGRRSVLAVGDYGEMRIWDLPEDQ
jgi:WD40 repeat protein